MIHEGDEVSARLAQALFVFLVSLLVTVLVFAAGHAARILDARAERKALDELDRKSTVSVVVGRTH